MAPLLVPGRAGITHGSGGESKALTRPPKGPRRFKGSDMSRKPSDNPCIEKSTLFFIYLAMNSNIVPVLEPTDVLPLSQVA